MKFKLLPKLIFMSKLLLGTIILQTLLLSALFASDGNSQNMLKAHEVFISVDLKGASLVEVFNLIESKTEFTFSYEKKDLEGNVKIDLISEKQSVADILRQVARVAKLKFKQVNNNINVRKMEAGSEQSFNIEVEPAAIRVSGKVVSQEDGTGIPGVNVMVKGSSIGTVTNIEGNYSLNAPNGNDTLVFSFIGYSTEEVPINNRSVIDVTLSSDVKTLDELVVVGYGKQKKTDVTGAIASVSAQQIENRPVTNATEALAGQMAGVQVQQIDGSPGGGGLVVQIRGTGTITAGSSPLYVVDGYPIEGDISMISPNDIESIQVLKDASATAIYGSRGGNGVVIVTTKRGSAGKPRVELNSYYGFQQVARKVDMMDSHEYVEWFIDGRNNAWIQEGGNADDPNDVRPPNLRIPDEYFNPESLPNTNWQDEIFRTAPMQNHQLSVSGGTENTRYFISGGFVQQDGIIINTDYKRYNLRSNVTSSVSDKIEVGLDIDASMAKSNHIENGKYGPVQLSLVVPPTFPVYNPDGSFSSPLVSPYNFHQGDDPNPVEIATQIDDTRQNYRTLGQIFVNYEILEGLEFKVKLGGVLKERRNSYYRPSYVNRDSNKAPNQVEAESETSHDTDWLLENTLSYNREFNNIHSISAVVGYTRQKHTYEDNYIFATNFPNDNVTTLNNGQVTDGYSTISEFALVSYLARVNYAFNEKYLFTATVRTDGSSRFGQNNRWGTFPSASLGWRVSEERFMQDLDIISDLKIRTSYGLTGNNAIPNYGPHGLLGVDQYVLGNGLVNGVYPNTISNPNLGWEMAGQLDVGIELGLFSNRVLLEADYYNRITRDLLLNVPVPTITGYEMQLQNIGKVQNRGVELSASTVNLTGNLKWTSNFNITFNRNIVLALGPDDSPIYASAPNVPNGFITEVGQPVANFYGYDFIGVYLTKEQIEASAHHPSTVPGDPIIRDVNEDGIINSDDRTVIGNNQPDFIFGFNNNFSYRNFDLGVQINGSQGAEVFSMSSRFTKWYHGERNARVDAVNRWRSPEQPGDGEYFVANRNYTGLQKQPSSYWVQDASYIRIRNVSLGYNLPESVLEKLPVQSSRFYISAQNLYTFTDYFGFDPEVSTSGSGLTRGGDYTGYPTARTITFGVNVVF